MNEREQFKLVPIEPTEEMISAAFVFLTDRRVANIDDDDVRGAIRYATQAAPSQPAQEPVALNLSSLLDYLKKLESNTDVVIENLSITLFSDCSGEITDFNNTKIKQFNNIGELKEIIGQPNTTPPSEAARIAELEEQCKKMRDVLLLARQRTVNLYINYGYQSDKDVLDAIDQAIADKG